MRELSTLSVQTQLGSATIISFIPAVRGSIAFPSKVNPFTFCSRNFCLLRDLTLTFPVVNIFDFSLSIGSFPSEFRHVQVSHLKTNIMIITTAFPLIPKHVPTAYAPISPSPNNHELLERTVYTGWLCSKSPPTTNASCGFNH